MVRALAITVHYNSFGIALKPIVKPKHKTFSKAHLHAGGLLKKLTVYITIVRNRPDGSS